LYNNNAPTHQLVGLMGKHFVSKFATVYSKNEQKASNIYFIDKVNDLKVSED